MYNNEQKIIGDYNNLLKEVKKRTITISVKENGGLSKNWFDEIAQKEISSFEIKYNLFGEFELVNYYVKDYTHFYIYKHCSNISEKEREKMNEDD